MTCIILAQSTPDAWADTPQQPLPELHLGRGLEEVSDTVIRPADDATPAQVEELARAAERFARALREEAHVREMAAASTT
ncbi:hypothetical protein HNR23_002297 [Nocardiopsis mwathae]|uniref:Uncharacterized protein n=1 Tax=Nocardiopsis mwathae TaxID=1472723 RepID=A0A7W9YHI9_9ACTN|nr:hypothetical protein [Nocardiopsis mwathae]MBB6172237.1 hypothetical protein [Nocardiopsis mwathae]